jgi:hypothetical protein
MSKTLVPTFENTPPVTPIDLKEAIDIAVTLGTGREDRAWLAGYYKCLLARWPDRDLTTALWVRSRALLSWASDPAVTEADALARVGWLAREARREGEPLPHPALLDWHARLQAAATYPLNAAGQLDGAFQQAVTEVKVSFFEG